MITRVFYRLIPRDVADTPVPERSTALLIPSRESGRMVVHDSTVLSRGLPRWFVDSVEGRCPF